MKNSSKVSDKKQLGEAKINTKVYGHRIPQICLCMHLIFLPFGIGLLT